MNFKLCFSAALLLPLAGCHKEEPVAKPVVAVQMQRAAQVDVPLTVAGPATIFGRSEAHISARMTAPVAALYVHKGDEVKKGQLLATLASADLRAQTSGANAAVLSARANLQRTQNGTMPTELSQAEADVEAKSAAFQLAQRVREKRDFLFAQGAISGREAQVSRADEAQAKANLDAAKKKLEVTQRATNAADLKIAQSSLAQAQAQQQLAAANLNFAELRSPANGTVTEQTMYPGDMARPDVPIFTVIDLSVAVARVQINADKAGSVSVGQPCRFLQKQESDAGLLQRSGTVSVVNQAVDPARHTIEVWCDIQNRDHALKAGIFGSVEIAVGEAKGAVVLPASAVEFDEGTHDGKLYVVDGKSIAHVRKVKAVPVDEAQVRVISGLRPGELVVTSGEYGVPDGTEVRAAGVQQ